MRSERHPLPQPGQATTPAGEEQERPDTPEAREAHAMVLNVLDFAQPGPLPSARTPAILPLSPALDGELAAHWLQKLRLRCLWLWPVALHLLGAGVMLYLFAFNLSVVRGKSMSPGIFDGDRILVDQFSYLFSDIQRGDIIVLQYPRDPRLDYIKRVVGLPGDEIEMFEGRLYINGDRVSESYLLEPDPYTDLHLTVEPEHYFVLGDNRLHSSDSREFGQVEENLVRGKVDLRLWPFERIGRIR